MNNRSFSSRLSWRIIGIVSVIFLASFVVIGIATQYVIAHESARQAPLLLVLSLLIAGILGLVIVFFVCRKEIRRMTRPITELSVSAMNMGMGNFKAKLPEISSKDEMRRLRDSFVYLQNSVTDYIVQMKTTKSDNERMESELNVARTIQMGMLSTDFPPQLHALLRPAKEVGGDLYDFIQKGDVLHFAVGDVSGKGVPSAMVMSVILSMFRAFSAHENNPAHIMQAINEASCRGNDSNMFVTMFIGVLDLPTGRLRYCDAGHDAPFIMVNGPLGQRPLATNGTQEWSMVNVIPHLPVGVFDDVKYGVQEALMAPDSTIFLYTDGLTEAKNLKRKQFGINRVEEVLAANSQLPPQQLLEAITNKVHEFVGDAEQSDDLTMMAVHYTPYYQMVIN